uniref:tRNA (guanine(26)-N(2))-dimethyltransferase n=1 Tax=Dermatophagoides pteronyssinus TaxID=6956 RepID=A0A6P6Y600_DERPT
MRNRALNGVPAALLHVTRKDANQLLYESLYSGAPRFNVIDVDPYGSIAPFSASAVQAVADGGLLCFTSTDMPVLGGNDPAVAFARYGGCTLKAPFLHEMSLRVLLFHVCSLAAQHRRHVEPLLSLSVDFYVRLFVRRQKIQCLLNALEQELPDVPFFYSLDH